MPRLRPLAGLAAAAAVALTSCGGSDLRKTYPVSGTLTLDGKPAPPGVVVSLHPQFTETDRLPIHPRGETDANGRFTITTYNANDGAPEGEYVVAVEFPQRIGLSPHFSGDLFGGAFAKPEANKEKPEFRLTVGPNSGNLELKLTLTPDARKRVEEGLKKAKQGGPTLGGGP